MMQGRTNETWIRTDKTDYYSFFTNFLICAFFGWVFETVCVYILSGQLTERGLLFISGPIGSYIPGLNGIPGIGNLHLVWGLPIIVIYGLSGSLISLTYRKISPNPFIQYLLGIVLITLFELFSSYFCEFVLHRTYWDYSAEPLNFQGRICVRASIAWGLISVFTARWIIPYSYLIYRKGRKLKHIRLLMNALLAYMLVCIYVKYRIGP